MLLNFCHLPNGHYVIEHGSRRFGRSLHQSPQTYKIKIENDQNKLTINMKLN